MQYIIQFARYVYKLGNVMIVKLKIFELEKVLDIAKIAGDQVIHTNYVVIFLNKSVA